MVHRSLLALFICIGSSLCALPQQLKKVDVRNTVEDMLSYHVEYKELNPLLVKRCFKSYLEQFDGQKVFLLQAEVSPFLNLSSHNFESIIEHYYFDEYPEFETLNRVIGKAIERARVMRHEIIRDLVVHGEGVEESPLQLYSQHAKTPDELKGRIRAQLVHFLLSEKKSNDPGFWTPARREKIF